MSSITIYAQSRGPRLLRQGGVETRRYGGYFIVRKIALTTAPIFSAWERDLHTLQDAARALAKLPI